MTDKKTMSRKEALNAVRQTAHEWSDTDIKRRGYVRGTVASIIGGILTTLGIQSGVDPVAAKEQEDVDAPFIRKVLQKYGSQLADLHAAGMIGASDVDALLTEVVDVNDAYAGLKEVGDKDSKVLFLPLSGPEGDFWGWFHIDEHGFGIPERGADFDLQPFVNRLNATSDGSVDVQAYNTSDGSVNVQAYSCICEEPIGCCDYGSCRVCSDGDTCNTPPAYCRCECGVWITDCDNDGTGQYDYNCDICASHPWCAYDCPDPFWC